LALRFSLDGRAAFGDVGFDDLLPFSLSFEDELYRVTEGAFASGVRGRVVGFFLNLGASVFYRDCQATGTHGGEVDDVVAHEGGLLEGDSGFFDDFPKGRRFVLNALANEFQFEIAGTEGDGFRDTLRDEAGPDAGEAREGDRSAIVGVEAFGFDQGLALETESALATLAGGLLKNALGRAWRSGEDEELAVGEDAVDVEEEEFDFAGASLRGESFGHRGKF